MRRPEGAGATAPPHPLPHPLVRELPLAGVPWRPPGHVSIQVVARESRGNHNELSRWRRLRHGPSTQQQESRQQSPHSCH